MALFEMKVLYVEVDSPDGIVPYAQPLNVYVEAGSMIDALQLVTQKQDMLRQVSIRRVADEVWK